MSAADSGSRLLIGNLDVEQDLARALPEDRQPRRFKPSLPHRVLQPIAAFATLMRVWASPGDRLWTPFPVDPAVIPTVVPGATWDPRPKLVGGPLVVSGPLPSPKRPNAILSWGHGPSVSALAEACDPIPNPGSGLGDDREAASSPAIWRLQRSSPEVVARVHHRAFALQVARRLGIELPGSLEVTSFEHLDEHLQRVVADGFSSRWVLKAPLSAAGRDRVLGEGQHLDDSLRRRVGKLFVQWPSLIFEPWMVRLEDVGACAVVGSEAGAESQGEASVRILGMHRQLVNSRGQFLGIELWRKAPWPPATTRRWTEIVRQVGRELAIAGYRGPFGVDGFRYRLADGTSRWHILGEINARMTFGLIARAWMERLRDSMPTPSLADGLSTVGSAAGPEEGTWRLHLSNSGRLPEALPGQVHWPLLQPASGSRAVAWLESPAFDGLPLKP